MSLPLAIPFLTAALLILAVAAVWDLKERIIPDRLVLAVLLIGGTMRLLADGGTDWLSPLAAILVFLPLSFLASRNAIGGGDVKMIAAVTFLFPPERLALPLVMIPLMGGILAMTYLMVGHAVRNWGLLRASAFAGPSMNSGPGLLRIEASRAAANGPMPFAVAIFAGVAYSIFTEALPCIYETSFSTSCSL